MPELKKTFGEGGAQLDRFSRENLYELIAGLIADIAALKQEVTDLDTATTSGITITPVTTTQE
jgi:hypothetical protein